MSRKRRAESLSEPDEDESSDTLSSDSEVDSDDGSSGDEAGKEELVNCDFEFFDPQKQDFLGIKHLLRQLFDNDADSFDLGALAEMVLAQPLVGTTVKTEGNESDPLSFLTVLNLRVHKVSPCQPPYANLIG
jgi:protein BCP1